MNAFSLDPLPKVFGSLTQIMIYFWIGFQRQAISSTKIEESRVAAPLVILPFRFAWFAWNTPNMFQRNCSCPMKGKREGSMKPTLSTYLFCGNRSSSFPQVGIGATSIHFQSPVNMPVYFMAVSRKYLQGIQDVCQQSPTLHNGICEILTKNLFPRVIIPCLQI